MAGDDQLRLFDAPKVTVAPRVRPARHGEPILQAAWGLPSALRLGTTGWTTPDWDGWVWERPQPPGVLAREGIGAYARHPLLRTVLLDRSSRLTLTTETLARLAAAVPEDFRFVVQADVSLFMGCFPGGDNPSFFDVDEMTRRCVEPFVEGLAERGGVLLIQIPSQDPRALGTRKAFPERLHRFLRALPAGPHYAVELRDHKLLTETYADALADVGATHCYSIHPSMHDLDTQHALTSAAPELPRVIRWTMCEHFDYQLAARNYAPYDALVERDPKTRDALSPLLAALTERSTPTYLLVDNMAEGCAPATLVELAQLLTAT